MPFCLLFPTTLLSVVPQDQLVLQMIAIFDHLLKQEGLDLELTPYRVLATGPQRGLSDRSNDGLRPSWHTLRGVLSPPRWLGVGNLIYDRIDPRILWNLSVQITHHTRIGIGHPPTQRTFSLALAWTTHHLQRARCVVAPLHALWRRSVGCVGARVQG